MTVAEDQKRLVIVGATGMVGGYALPPGTSRTSSVDRRACPWSRESIAVGDRT